MCQPKNGIMFCTCIENDDINAIVHNKNSRKNKKKLYTFSWTLDRYLGQIETSMDGMVAMPSNALSNGLSDEFVLNELNNKNCFDFDYTPVNGDNLKIYPPLRMDLYKFLSYVFKNDAWGIGCYISFSDNLQKINYGNLKMDIR
jgi:hypothetical protein